MIRILTRKQVEQVRALLQEYGDADEVTFTIGNGGGIGTNIYATVKYTACHEHTIDITDYENW